MTGWTRHSKAHEEKELREALALAHKVLSDIAQSKGLDPDGERARDLCSDALKKLGNDQRRSRGLRG